ncbi:MAG: hypothetical protein Q7U04_02340, partial [Bacteriovorax sp.]|nr:hypothetical protein [Bacteriovorax sp.]
MKIKQKVEDFEIYFSSNFGLENKTFEDLLRFQNTSTTEASDDQYIKHQITWPKLTFWNSYLYAEEQDNPFYLFQFSNEQKDLSFQLIVYVETSRVFGFKQGVIRQWSISPELLASGQLAKIIEAINDILQKNTPLISLRLQPYMPGIEVINKLKSIFLKLGLKKISAIAPEQTRFMDLRLSINDILKK